MFLLVHMYIGTHVHIVTYMLRPPRGAWRTTSLYYIRRQRVKILFKISIISMLSWYRGGNTYMGQVAADILTIKRNLVYIYIYI